MNDIEKTKNTDIVEVRLNKISELMEESLTIFRKDKKLAMQNYDQLRSQLNDLLETGIEMSEEGKLEKQVNEAFKIYIMAGKKLDDTINALNKILITQLNNQTKLQVANKLSEGNEKKYLDSPANFKVLTED